MGALWRDKQIRQDSRPRRRWWKMETESIHLTAIMDSAVSRETGNFN